MHLIAVRQDLAAFQHLHPAPTGAPGEYAVGIVFPTMGTYVLYDEFVRANGQDIVRRDELVVGMPSGAASLAEDRAPKIVDDVRVGLHADRDLPTGRPARLTFQLADTQSGEPLRDLQPYLGAPAHVVILTEDARRFAHTHGEAVGVGGHHADAAPHGEHGGGHAGHGGTSSSIGPEVAFEHTFPAAGLYKLWGQFQTREGRVITADFVVRAQ
jgi:P-type Cu+ transporter